MKNLQQFKENCEETLERCLQNFGKCVFEKTITGKL